MVRLSGLLLPERVGWDEGVPVAGRVASRRRPRSQTEQGAPQLASNLARLVEEAEAVSGELRRIAHGLSPPLLATQGLVDALRNECLHSGIPVQIVADDIGLSKPDVETAVYLSCLEAVQNTAKHGGSDVSATVRLRRRANELAFSVQDTGRGFDPQTTVPGSGLTGLKDRIDTIGGQVEIWRHQAAAPPSPAPSHGPRARDSWQDSFTRGNGRAAFF
jgi:signal transduction histidine kinase